MEATIVFFVCFSIGLYHGQAQISCTNNNIRLVDGYSQYEGRVEVCYNNTWGTVCDDKFDANEAIVICRQLGHSGSTAYSRAYYGQGTGPIYLDDLGCTGNEQRLSDCNNYQIGPNNCDHTEDASVSCEVACPSTTGFQCSSGRCVNRTDVCNMLNNCGDGSDELGCDQCSSGMFRCNNGNCVSKQSVCNYANNCGDNSDELGCGICSPTQFQCYFWNCISASLVCNGVVDCPTWWLYTDGSDEAGCPTNCTDFSLRLMGGATRFEGRVEMCYDNQWGTICDDHWDTPDAIVTCRQLGYKGGTALRNAYFGLGSGPILLDELACTGTERMLINCSSDGLGVHNCIHEEDAGVRCVDLCSGLSCDNNNCIPNDERCNFENNCGDGSDEINCGNCNPTSFRCKNQKCVSKYAVCDYINDCGDNSDEFGCDTCSVSQFRCYNGYCISSNLTCNGAVDCLYSDKSDERGCPCSNFTCASGECISTASRCNNTNDCGDGSDEVGCGSCTSSQFRCQNGNCVGNTAVCNSNNDCEDRSDEFGCGTCSSSQFRCAWLYQCIPKSAICDGVYNCAYYDDYYWGDLSDESDCPITTITSQGTNLATKSSTSTLGTSTQSTPTPAADTTSEVANIGGIAGGVVGGIVGLAAVLFVALVVGILIARKKPGDRGLRYHSLMPTTIATSASTGLEFLEDEGPLLGTDINSSENNVEDTSKSSTEKI